MIEVEIRTLIENYSDTENKLKSYPLVKQKIQIDEYFSHPSRDFYANPVLREYLRIRHDKKPCLEYHKAHIKNGKKTHTEEFEVIIEDTAKMKEILLQLGFKPLVTVEKDRKIFDCGEFEASLDNIKELGSFLEIEAKRDFGGIEKTIQECINFLEKLGLEYMPAPQKGYPDMLVEKLSKKPNTFDKKGGFV